MVAKDSLGRHILSEKDCIKLLLSGAEIDTVYVDDSSVSDEYTEQNAEYFQYDSVLSIAEDIPFEDFHQKMTNKWFMPDKYMYIDVKDYVLDKVTTQEERDRVEMEYAMFEERDLLDVLRLMIFLIEFFRENNIIWGVGRGSSVSSYILYKIGVHRVNSLKYNLDITEFLK